MDDFHRITAKFPDLSEVMLGRGLVANPALARQISGGQPMNLEELKGFIEKLETSYKEEIHADESIMHKMKEIWFYVGDLLIKEDGTDAEAYIHKIRTSKNVSEYRNAVRAVYKNCIIKER